MRIYSFEDIVKNKKDGIITIGYFDSVHIGHQKLINTLLQKSEETNTIPYLLTFDNLYYKEKNGKKILELSDKIDLLKNFGVKNLILCKFDSEFAKISAEDFLLKLKKNFNIINFVCGEDFHFGHNKKGGIKLIEKLGYKVFVVQSIVKDGIRVSTSVIKKLVLEGEIETANELIGRPFFIKGMVFKGKQLGRKLGFPTFNLFNDNVIKPKNGVYLTKVAIKDAVFDSMTYVSDNVIETYALGYNKFSYGFKIRVDFFKKIRDNMHFNNSDMLVKQLYKDLEELKHFIRHRRYKDDHS